MPDSGRRWRRKPLARPMLERNPNPFGITLPSPSDRERDSKHKYLKEDFDIHLECDVSALENDLGFGTGDWVPYLTVDYQVIHGNGNGDVAAEGTFMVMSASDGPHYGANVSLPDADTYKNILTFHNPEENGYLVHTDAETGPGGTFDEYFADGNLTVEYEGWDYTPMEF